MFIQNHTNHILHIWNLNFNIQVCSDILLFAGIHQPIFVIFIVYIYVNFLIMNQKLNQEWRENWQNNELTKPRLIKSDWLVTFPWLINKNRLFRCNICVSAKMSNVFVSGKDDVVKHQ